MSFLRLAFRSAVRPSLAVASAPRLQLSRLRPRAAFSAAAGLQKAEIETRILDVVKSFEKLNVTSSFSKDLGLDSLDAVEVVMAEFSIEIPDAEADEIKTVQQGVYLRPLSVRILESDFSCLLAIDYIAKTPEAH
ncbi:hypothetical protein EW146_g9559 [Bondarzewia mesenterica]|uniref:Acyl carrier protein n=1 Tax=Bondarzewia mesenterica TaxID=1095465 RepID=A0A4S4L5G3_9AGAM|nr:hypothetical protein EW146_g9559 [Bondarzewia mesenterica]